MSKHLRWLEGEIRRWTASGIVTVEQAAAIRGLYADATPRLPWGTIVFFGLGAVVAGCGVILLFAYNWDAVPKFGKLALVFGAVAAAHGGGLALGGREGWRGQLGEALALLGTMMFGAAIWLTAQIYHIEEHFPNGFLVWALGALAMAWALGSVANGILAAVLFAIWGGIETLRFHSPGDWVLVILPLTLGALAWRLRSALLLAFVVLAVYWLALCHAGHWGSAGTAFAIGIAFAVLLIGLAKQGWLDWTDAQRRVFEALGVAGFLVCAYLVTFHRVARDLVELHREAASSTMGLAYRWVGFSLAAAVWARVLWEWRAGERERLGGAELLFPIALVYVQALPMLGVHTGGIFPATVFNLVCLGLAAAWMVRGCRESRLREVVLGSVLLGLVLFARYFDLFDSLALRGLAFIGFGAVLFAEGFYYRKLRRTADTEAAS